MKYLSICSGIEAASVAFGPLGWRPLAFSEIEAFPRAVLQHHYPNVPLHGDFTELRHQPWIVDADLLCGGTPCQAFSVAGQRKSLADDRGNLSLQFILLADAIDALRHDAGRDPAWILWENVPGVLSTHDNAFGSFLGGLCGRDAAIPEPEGGWTRAGVVNGPTRCAAWRIMDAQHFGLAQRRQRVFVLALGGAGRWAAADALLPIIESSKWHPAPSRGAGEGVAGTLSARTEGGGGLGTDFECGGGLTVFDPAQVTSKANRSNPQPGDPCHTLHRNDPPMLVRMREGKEGGGKGPLVSQDQSLTLATSNDQILAFQGNASASNSTNPGAVAPTLDKGKAYGMAVAFQPRYYSNRPRMGGEPSDKVHTLSAAAGQGDSSPHIANGMQVRRLTPVECERLQGFPDGYTNIPWRGKPESPDGPRYKALGNSWAVPVVRWIGEQIKAIRP